MRTDGAGAAPLLHSLCEAMARWGDVSGSMEGICRALVEGLPGVGPCWAYTRDRSGETTLVACFPGAGRGVTEGVLSFAEDTLATEGMLTRDNGDGSVLYGGSAVTGTGDGMALVARSLPGLSAEERDRIGDCLGLAVSLVLKALESLESIEAGMEDRAIQRAQVMRSEMIATLSHEMRTPLAVIKGYVTALLRNDVNWDEQTRLEFLQTIDQESDKLDKMAAGILDMAAMEVGQITIEKSPALLPRLVSDAVSKIGVKSKKHRFVVDFEADFPVAPVDTLRIEQVLYNLLDNAVKYSPDGGLIVISGRVRPDHIEVEIADQGKGIPAEHLNRLFEKYFRIGSQKRVGGLGLGLPIARQIVEWHGGRIWAESAEGRGTTVFFTLPIDASGEEP